MPLPRPVAVSLTPLPLEADSRAYRIACGLAEAGFRSIVVEGRASRRRFWGGDIEVRALAGPAPESGGTALRGGASRNGRFGAAGELALYAAFRGRDWWRHCRQRRGLVPDADLYYLHSFELHRAVAGRGAPIVYDAHDFYRGIEPPERQPAFDRHRLRPFFDRLEDRAVASAASFVTVSDGVASLMEQSFGRRPIVIRNCHDERRDRPIERDLRTRLGLEPSDVLGVVVGNRKRGMALDAAADAMALLPPRFHLAFVGRGYDADRDRLRGHSAAARLHLGHCVAPDEVVPLIRTADLGLIVYEPYSDNYRFALPNGFFQCVAAGLPMVRGMLPEIETAIGGRAVGACLDRLTAPQLAAAIAACAADAAMLRAEMARLARELRWQRELAHLHRLVARVLPDRGPMSATPAVLELAE